ncbi:MAG: RNA ligase family protein [Nitrososphaeraceae archaeon]|nr:RNA ligase family protein [Nitrososphaeraceae archaeon]
MKRALATIAKIDKIYEHPNADHLEIALIRGWQVIVLKNNYQEGERVIFFEIDSFIPTYDEFKFLEKSCLREVEGIKGYRIKTVRLRGELSQGLITKLDFLNTIKYGDQWTDKPIGTDVTELLGVLNYNDLEMGDFISSPSYVLKREEDRVQNLTNKWDYYKKLRYYTTEKLEGMRCSIWKIPNGEVQFGMKNKLINTSDHPFVLKMNELGVPNVLKEMDEPLLLAGELIGPKIQGNYYKLAKHKFFAFTLYNYKDYRRKSYKEYSEFCFVHNIPMVPLIYFNIRLPEDPLTLVALANGKSRINQEVMREGLIYRSIDTNDGFKVIDNEFLINNDLI